MNNYHQYLPIATASFPSAVGRGDDGYMHLKPAKEFMGEVINFVWPVILIYLSSRFGFKAMKELFLALRGS